AAKGGQRSLERDALQLASGVEAFRDAIAGGRTAAAVAVRAEAAASICLPREDIAGDGAVAGAHGLGNGSVGCAGVAGGVVCHGVLLYGHGRGTEVPAHDYGD